MIARDGGSFYVMDADGLLNEVEPKLKNAIIKARDLQSCVLTIPEGFEYAEQTRSIKKLIAHIEISISKTDSLVKDKAEAINKAESSNVAIANSIAEMSLSGTIVNAIGNTVEKKLTEAQKKAKDLWNEKLNGSASSGTSQANVQNGYSGGKVSSSSARRGNSQTRINSSVNSGNISGSSAGQGNSQVNTSNNTNIGNISGSQNSGNNNTGVGEVTKPPEILDTVKFQDENGNVLITAKTEDGKDVFYDTKTGKEITDLGPKGTKWSDDAEYLQQMKDRAIQNGDGASYYVTVDKSNGNMVLMIKLEDEWRVVKTYDSKIENLDGNSEITLTEGLYSIDSKESQDVDTHKWYTTYILQDLDDGTNNTQAFYANIDGISEEKVQSGYKLDEDATKWIYSNVPVGTTVEVVDLNQEQVENN